MGPGCPEVQEWAQAVPRVGYLGPGCPEGGLPGPGLSLLVYTAWCTLPILHPPTLPYVHHPVPDSTCSRTAPLCDTADGRSGALPAPRAGLPDGPRKGSPGSGKPYPAQTTLLYPGKRALPCPER